MKNMDVINASSSALDPNATDQQFPPTSSWMSPASAVSDASATEISSQQAAGDVGWRFEGMGVAAILTSLILVGTALGNILVCLAIYLEKRLHNMTNYFLMSLAVTDLMVAVSVMPLGIITINEGFFPLPSLCCFTWVMLDVLFCTCSIMHLCTISVDRFLSLRYPIKYGRIKTKKRVVLKICFVWLLSIAMSLPIAFLYASDEQFVLRNGACYLQDPLYVTIGSIVCFYIPLAIMLVTYALTVHLLNQKAIQVCAKNGSSSSSKGESGSTPLVLETTFTTSQPSTSTTTFNGWRRMLSKTYSASSSTIEVDTQPSSSAGGGGETASTSTNTSTPAGSGSRGLTMVDTHIPVAPLPARKEVHAIRKYSVKCRPGSRGLDQPSDQHDLWLQVTTDPSGKTYSSVLISSASVKNIPLDASSPKSADQQQQQLATDDVISVDNDSSQSTTSQSFREASSSISSRQEATSLAAKDVSRSPSNPCMRKWAARNGRFLRAERKASKVLGVVFFTFVVLWSPFFLLNLLSVCKECVKHISPQLQDTALWLGYASSMVNPIFYTVFNKTFRQTFAKILKCRWKEIKR